MLTQIGGDNRCFSFIIIGRSGVGKSTFLKTFSGLEGFISSSSAKSCTKKVYTYPFYVENATIMPIDTPGSYDSDGIEEEQKNMELLVDFLRKFEHGLNGIAIVISRSDCRLDQITKKQIKMLNQIIRNNKMWSHLCVIVTHCPRDPEDLEELKQSMTNDKDSLKTEMQKLIKGISHIDDDLNIPFFFVDSKHPDCSPSRETLPQFRKWLFTLSSLQMNNLSEPNVQFQFKEKRSSTETLSGEICPIYQIERGPNKKITITEKVPVPVTKIRHRKKTRTEEYWETRKVDAGDIWSLGIARAFRKNKIKCTRQVEYDEAYECQEIEYHDRQKVIEEPGDLQKVLKGYYQEIKTLTKSWFAFWNFDVDIIDKCNQSYESEYEIINETTKDYFDDKKNRLSTIHDLEKINELKKLNC